MPTRHSPLNELEIWAHQMAELSRFLVRDVMAEMSPVPNDNVSTIDRFAIHPRVETRLERRSGGYRTIVYL